MKRAVSPAFFVLAALAFFLPFFTVQCAGGGLPELPDVGLGEEAELETTVTGFELVTSQAEEQLSEPAPAPAPTPTLPGLEDVPGAGETETQVELGTVQILAIAAVAAAVLGIFLSLLAGRTGGAIALGLGAVGVVLLFLVRMQFQNAVFGDLEAEARQFIEVQTEYGYWLALVLMLLAAIWGVVLLLTGTRAAEPAPYQAPPEEPPPAPPPPEPPPA